MSSTGWFIFRAIRLATWQDKRPVKFVGNAGRNCPRPCYEKHAAYIGSIMDQRVFAVKQKILPAIPAISPTGWRRMFEFVNYRCEQSDGSRCRARSDSVRNPIPTGCDESGDEPGADRAGRSAGTSTYLVPGSAVSTCDAVRGQADASLFLRFSSSRPLARLAKERLLLFGRQKSKASPQGHQQDLWIAAVQIRSRQEVGTDHLQAIAA